MRRIGARSNNHFDVLGVFRWDPRDSAETFRGSAYFYNETWRAGSVYPDDSWTIWLVCSDGIIRSIMGQDLNVGLATLGLRVAS